MAVHVGDKLKNRYRIEESLGRGGMADVYKVWDTQRGVPLAVKVLREDLAEDIVFLRRFEREAKNLTRLQHPNIVRCYGLVQKGHTAFMLMDYIDGWTLRSEIFDAKGPLPLSRILEIMQPVCSALNYAHQMGMVHCDVKSANIMVGKNGTVYLTDFGIARGIDTATSTMVGIGTPAYMAPELIKGQDPTPQTDIYSLGIVLFEMLTGGERPFTGERATITGTTADRVRWEQLKLEPIPITHFNKEIPQKLQENLLLALKKEPTERFSNMLEFWEAVDSTIPQELRIPSEERNISETPTSDVSSSPALFNSTSEKKNKTWKESYGFWLAFGAIGLYILIAIINGISPNRSSSVNESTRTKQIITSEMSAYSPPDVIFYADANTISYGKCTVIHWDVENVQQVFVENEEMSFSGEEYICPSKTTIYELSTRNLDGELSNHYITVNVRQKATTVPTEAQQKTCEGKINKSGTRVRRDPSYENPNNILGILYEGDKVTLYEVDSSKKWGRVTSQRLRDGWVYLKYIDFSDSCTLIR